MPRTAKPKLNARVRRHIFLEPATDDWLLKEAQRVEYRYAISRVIDALVAEEIRRRGKD